MGGIATVVKNAGSHYLLSELPAWELFPAVLRGKVRLERSGATNPVAVGDRVRYETDGPATEEHPAVIKEILPRENYLIRRSTNLSRQSHVIAANLDQAVIVVSLLFPELKLPFLDRILVTCEVYKVPVLIVQGDSDDLVPFSQGLLQFEEQYTNPRVRCVEITTEYRNEHNTPWLSEASACYEYTLPAGQTPDKAQANELSESFMTDLLTFLDEAAAS